MTPETTERGIHQRPGVGATAYVQQGKALGLRNLVIENAMLVVVMRGTKMLISPHVDLKIKEGDAVLLTDGAVFDVANIPAPDGRYEALWISFDPAFISFDRNLSTASKNINARTDKKDAYAVGDLQPPFMNAVATTANAIRDRGVSDDIVRHRLNEIRLWLRERNIPWPHHRTYTLSAKLRHKLAASPNEQWTTELLARHFAMSEATLRRHLAAEGTSLTTLIVDVSMTFALTLLQSTDKPIEQIAYASGYQSASRFSIRFRERFGFAPSEIRGHRRERRLECLNHA